MEKAIALLKQQNELVANHPNSHVYSQLLSLVDFEGFYLESEPCLVCNDPEIPFTVSGRGWQVWGRKVGWEIEYRGVKQQMREERDVIYIFKHEV